MRCVGRQFGCVSVYTRFSLPAHFRCVAFGVTLRACVLRAEVQRVTLASARWAYGAAQNRARRVIRLTQ